MISRVAPVILLLAFSACDRAAPPDEQAVVSISRAQAQDVYLKNCAICHGEKGDGHGPRRGSLFRKPPDFRQPEWRRNRSLAEIRFVIRNGKPGSDMPAWKSLDASEVSGVAEYVLAFTTAARRQGAGE